MIRADIKIFQVHDGFISNGSAVNMCDPSSMRDQGITRNAIYVAEIDWSPDRKKKPYDTFMRRDGSTNNGFYSFGGSKAVRSASAQKDLMINPYFKDFDGHVRDRQVIVYPKDPLARV